MSRKLAHSLVLLPARQASFRAADGAPPNDNHCSLRSPTVACNPPTPQPPDVNRRAFLRSALAATIGVAAVPLAAVGKASAAEEGPSPYGPLADRDGSGILLPEGFTARTIVVEGDPVGPRDLVWRGASDGAATFAGVDGSWYHAINHEETSPDGGVSVLHYDSSGNVIDAYSVLEGTARNCAGGPTPWGTWLSCEEVAEGRVFECAIDGPGQGQPIDALGRFSHEAVAVDGTRGVLYLTEDESDSLLYRFVPDRYPNLDQGVLEAAVVVDGSVSWLPVPDPIATEVETRYQFGPDEAARFNGGEGIWYHQDRVWFTTKGDNRVWELDVVEQRLRYIWDASSGSTLSGVDNITVEEGSGDLIVAEDGGNMELVIITAEGTVAPLLRVTGHDGSELTGPVFNPAGDRLYVSSQRGRDGDGRAVTYEITGPFRGPDLRADPAASETNPETATDTSTPASTTVEPQISTEPTSKPTVPSSPVASLESAAQSGNAEGDTDAGGRNWLLGSIPVVALTGVALGSLLKRRGSRPALSADHDSDPSPDLDG